MCTAISINNSHHLFCRTLDLDCSYGESILVVPKGFQLDFRYEKSKKEHYAILGVGCVFDNTPLLYDGFNERGLAVAGLNFPDNAVYFEKKDEGINLASFELISFVLANCANVLEAADLLGRTNITNDSFNSELSATSLHWLISDSSGAITVESSDSGLKITENTFGVLTNSPEFSYHATRMSDYMALSAKFPLNNLCPSVSLSYYSKGLGAIGLPGDFSSSSRFTRAVFLKNHSVVDSVVDAFHVMDNLAVPNGAVITDKGKPFATVYTSVADTERGVYYFTTADSRRIRAVGFNEIT